MADPIEHVSRAEFLEAVRDVREDLKSLPLSFRSDLREEIAPIIARLDKQNGRIDALTVWREYIQAREAVLLWVIGGAGIFGAIGFWALDQWFKR